jgi:hypothetical protein
MSTKYIRGLNIKDRFMNKVEMIPFHTCWEWNAYKTIDGYGVFRDTMSKNKTKLAHRVSYELHNGAIPEGKLVCHTCDNTSCVNPSHLFLGTDQDNTNDKVTKKRHQFGQKVIGSKLDENMVREIREDCEIFNLSVIYLAKKYKVSRSSIQGIITRKYWKHIE